MSWHATERYSVREAPAGLALVQDLLNTRAVLDQPDILADDDGAGRWLAGAVSAWCDVRESAPPGRAPAPETARLRALRDRVAADLVRRDAPADEHAPPPAAPSERPGERAAPATLVADGSGHVRVRPQGTGASWLESALWSEVLLAQMNGTWPRLKVCRNPECQSAFYDASRNNSGVWHDVRVCGNAANLRASRARRRLRETGERAD